MSTSLQRRRCREPEIPLFSQRNDVSNGSFSGLSQGQRRRRKQHHSFKKRKKTVLYIIIFLVLLFLTGWLVGQLHLPFWRFHRAQELSLPIANVDIAVPNSTEWPLIHIVNTRFMQEQGHLATLGMARLHLFRTFCLPTMVGQSTQDFLWIIKADPNLDTTVLNRLLTLVRPYSNIYVVASNRNFLISPDLTGSWRDGAEGRDLISSRIFSGNLTRLQQAIALREERPILETRLDADDGLHQDYLKYIQWVAKRRFLGGDMDDDDSTSKDGEESIGHRASGSAPKWLYWCSRRHLEWRSGPMNQTSSEAGSLTAGYLNPVQHSKLCITPGITVGYNSGTLASEVPCEAHDLLFKHLMDSTSCYDGTNATKSAKKEGEPLCLELVDDLTFSAIRSRTWTSAGMQNVASPDQHIPADVLNKITQELWTFLEGRFHMSQDDAFETQRFLYKHQAQIAYENLLGQCTSFHSCKQQAKEALEMYVKDASAKGIQVIPQSVDGSNRLRIPS